MAKSQQSAQTSGDEALSDDEGASGGTGTATPAIVAQKATESGKISRRKLTLIGIFGSATRPSAMFFLPDGRVLSGALGAETEIGQIIGIDDTSVVLRQSGKTLRLVMPS